MLPLLAPPGESYSAKTGYDMRVVTTASASRAYSRALSIATAACEASAVVAIA